MTFDRDEQFLHEKLSSELHPAPAEAAPEMCRIALYTMETGTYQAALKFVRLAKQLGEKQGVSLADPRAFRMAAEAWDWGDGLSCAEYWRPVARGA